MGKSSRTMKFNLPVNDELEINKYARATAC